MFQCSFCFNQAKLENCSSCAYYFCSDCLKKKYKECPICAKHPFKTIKNENVEKIMN